MDLRSPRRHDLAALRVMARESEVMGFAQRFPHLSPSQILDVIVSAGPLRSDVEAELRRISAQASSPSRDN
jgi:hypothetical protein